ncbi:MAG: transglycosylase domain-containing protein [Actinomycetota bacterium]|nr:transglycosylase domain-containing protein [Actinomycetota bacterium]
MAGGSASAFDDSAIGRLLLGHPRRRRDRNRHPLWRFRRALFLLGLLGFGGLVGTFAVLSQIELDLTGIDDLAQSGYVCTADVTVDCNADNAVAELSAGEDRQLVSYSQIPAVVIQAVVATEDKTFFTHRGVDPAGILRALYRDVRNEGVRQGGSTITQQYVKNTFTGDQQSLGRKLREATLAVKLEREFSKEEVLERYLNRIYFGRGAYGIQAAAREYFDKNVEQLDLADAAFLAGLIRSPSRADPAQDPAEAARRREVTLRRMVEDGYITQQQADQANQRGWETVVPPSNREGLGVVEGSEFGTEYFIEAVRQEVALVYPEGELYTSGLRVYTTLRPSLQRAAFEAVTAVVDPRADPDDPAASLVAVDDKGNVVAMMGGYDFAASQVNLALGRDGGGSGRQPGSSFKPIVLAEALEQGLSAHSLFAAPSAITLPRANNGADWEVRGGGSPNGYRDLIDALRISSNVVYAQLMVTVGPETVVDLAARLGVSAELPAVNSLVLGSGEVSVLDMAAAYSTIANTGVRYAPVFIERIEGPKGTCWYPSGGVCAQAGPGRAPTDPAAIAPEVAQTVIYALEQVVNSGTGGQARFSDPAAGKTGTTQDNRDAWFVGFTCRLTAAVWMGYPGGPGEPIRTMGDFRGIEVHGGDFPATIWSAFMQKAADLRSQAGGEPCESLPGRDVAGGKVLNRQLSTTTLPVCAPLDPDAAAPGDDATAAPTTAPCAPDPNAPTTKTSTITPLDPEPDPATTSTTSGTTTTGASTTTTTTTTATTTITSEATPDDSQCRWARQGVIR